VTAARGLHMPQSGPSTPYKRRDKHKPKNSVKAESRLHSPGGSMGLTVWHVLTGVRPQIFRFPGARDPHLAQRITGHHTCTCQVQASKSVEGFKHGG